MLGCYIRPFFAPRKRNKEEKEEQEVGETVDRLTTSKFESNRLLPPCFPSLLSPRGAKNPRWPTTTRRLRRSGAPSCLTRRFELGAESGVSARILQRHEKGKGALSCQWCNKNGELRRAGSNAWEDWALTMEKRGRESGNQDVEVLALLPYALLQLRLPTPPLAEAQGGLQRVRRSRGREG